MSTFRDYRPERARPAHRDGAGLTGRQQAVADALGPARCEQIRERAKAEAARIMADFESGRGRR